MNNKLLKKEVDYFIRFFFKKETDEMTIDRYIHANKEVFSNNKITEHQSILLESLIENNVDIEAIEFAWRLKDRENVLSKKIQIVFYLLEVKSEFFILMINERKSILKASIILSFSICHSIYKLLKGLILLRRYHVV